MKKYYFKEIKKCEMCGDNTSTHKILGQRLNKPQGFKPKKKNGISVSVQKCTKCGLIYSNPQPIPFVLQDHYGEPPENYWNENYFQLKSDYFNSQIKTAKKLIDFKKGMKSLDVGAGLGKAMLSMENEGFDVYGFEPSVPFYERAISKTKVKKQKLKWGAIENVDYDNEIFDFISFGAVLEHLYNPSESLKKHLDG